MNTIRFFSFFLSLIFISGLTSCSDDDYDNKNSNPAELLIGTWNLTNLSVGIYTQDGKAVEISNESYDGVGSFTFKPNGELITIDVEGQQQIVSYEYNKGKIHMYIAGEEPVALDVMELTATKLVMELKEVDEDGKTSYMRVNYRKNFNSSEKEEEYNTELPKYIYIDENLGDQIDYAILGLDGSGYFYEFQDENPNIPQRLSIYDGKKDIVDLVINFDEEGLPKNILSEDFVIVLGKYEGKKFDAVIVTKDGKSQTFENLETDVSWDEYKNGISGITSRTSSQIKSSAAKNLLEWVNLAVGGVGCVLSSASVITAPIFAPFTTSLAAISCTNWIYEVVEIFSGETILPDFFSNFGYASTLYDCIKDGKTSWSCMELLTSSLLIITDWIENISTKDVELGEKILNTSTNGLTITSPSYGTTYHCGNWIDIFISGYTGSDWQDDLELQYWCLRGEPQPDRANEAHSYTNKAFPRKEGTSSNPSFTFSPEDPSVWDGRWVKLVAINKKNNTRSAPQYIQISPPDLSEVVGVWSGWYANRDGNATLTINQNMTGVFDFVRNGVSGSHVVRVDYSNGYNIRGTGWLSGSWDFNNSNLRGGVISNGVLSGSDFELKKVR